MVFSKAKPEKSNLTLIPLADNKGFIRRRSEQAVLRYYLNYSNDEDLARGLLILFLPFRHEITDIHQKDVKALLESSRDIIEDKRKSFEKYKVMEDLIASIGSDGKREEVDIFDEVEESEDIETTSQLNIDQFNKWAKGQAFRDLSEFKDLTDICDIANLRLSISSLNKQQRKIFDDIIEGVSSSDFDERPFYLFLSGNAGTGKSFLLRLLIDAVKWIRIKPGDDLKKPPVIVCAPTVNAASIVNGKTIDSVFGFLPNDGNSYSKANAGKMASMKFNFEDVCLVLLDKVSMVGASKLLKINYRLQDICDRSQQKQYMEGISFVASGTYLSNLTSLKLILKSN